jgi:RNA polymerase sigma-70 factor (TIGR02960 family)
VEQATLQRARDGDEQAFRELTDPYRRELQVHCYRLLGSLTDAEDMLQETLLAAWRGLTGFEQRSSVRTWLYRIATNQCLNALRAAGRRIPAEPAPPFQPPAPSSRGEITWLQPYPDLLLDGVPDPAPGPEVRYQAAEAIELAFVAGLQRLPPRQAATLVLRDVLGFGNGEVADMLGTTPTAVKGALQRARAALDARRDHQGESPRPGSAQERALARRFADAYLAADIDGVIALLTDDAWLSMPPAPHQYHGTAAIRSFLQASFGFRGQRRVHLVPARANTQPALGSYLSDPHGAAAAPAGLIVLTMAGDRISAVTRFHLDKLYPRFGLASALPGPAAAAQYLYGTDRGRSAAEPPVQLPDLVIQAGYRALHGQPGSDGADRQRAHRGRGHAELGEPAGQLLGRAHVDDAAQTDPGVRGRAHRAVLSGGEHGRGCPLAGRHVLGRPAGQLEFRVPGRVTQAVLPVAVLGQHLAVPADQHRAEREIPGLERFGGQFDAPAQVAQLLGREARGLGTGIVGLRHHASVRHQWFSKPMQPSARLRRRGPAKPRAGARSRAGHR